MLELIIGMMPRFIHPPILFELCFFSMLKDDRVKETQKRTLFTELDDDDFTDKIG